MIKSPSVWPLKQRIEFPAVRLNGPRILMRPPDPVDFPAWAALRERSKQHLTPFEPEWHEDSLTRDLFLRRIERQSRDWKAGLSCSFLIFRSEDQTVLGGMNINNIVRGAAQFCTLGYWLGEEHQGQGYMGEAMRLTLIYGFNTLKFHRFNAGTLPHNGRSIKLLRRFGFEEEGYAKSYLQINGEWQDHILFGLTEDQFQKSLNISA
ncbi:MAG: Ribosomal-protein-S5p-alanine acetyltransferase [Micavibrio sp.]|nr:Ribosomal-protein-S5p-alanine acetyltransferase [Micavibrio sp.]